MRRPTRNEPKAGHMLCGWSCGPRRVVGGVAREGLALAGGVRGPAQLGLAGVTADAVALGRGEVDRGRALPRPRGLGRVGDAIRRRGVRDEIEGHRAAAPA
jgi:hypothetical protein